MGCGASAARQQEEAASSSSTSLGSSTSSDASARDAASSSGKAATPSGVTGWTVAPVSGTSPTWSQLEKLLRVTDHHNLGIGRDVKEHNVYNQLEPVRAWSLNVKSRRALYDAAKEMVKEDLEASTAFMELPEVGTKLDAAGAELGGLDASTNEKFLIHGTKPETLLTIIRNGLNEKFSGGLLGDGLYLAEDPSKADQYCTADLGPDESEGLDGLHAKLYTDTGVEHPGGRVFYILVCRALVGIPVYTKDGETNMNPPENDVFADGSRRELAQIPGSEKMPVHYHTLIAEKGPSDDGYLLARHREFCIFHSNRVMEEYLVAYRRVMSADVEVSSRKTKGVADRLGLTKLRGFKSKKKGKGALVKVSCHPHPLTKFYNPNAEWQCDDPCPNCVAEAEQSERWSCRECDYDLCRACVKYWKGKDEPWQVGDIAEVRDGPEEDWVRGVVTQLKPLMVKPDAEAYEGEHYEWAEIRHTGKWTVGDWVSVRDAEHEDWSLGFVTKESPLLVQVPDMEEPYEWKLVRKPLNVAAVTPLNVALGATVMRNLDFDDTWGGGESILPPKTGSGKVMGYTDYEGAVRGEMECTDFPAMASVLWDGEERANDFRIGFKEEHWLGLLTGGAPEPCVDECYCILKQDDKLMNAFRRFPDDEVNGWTPAKQARCGQACKILVVYTDFTVNVEFFSDDVEMDFPYEALEPYIYKDSCLRLLAEPAKLAGSFGRFADDETNGWSQEKQSRCGKFGVVTQTFTDATVTLKFLSDDKEFDFPFESLCRTIMPDDTVRLLSDASAFRAAFARFEDDDEVNGWSQDKDKVRGCEATVIEVFEDHTVKVRFASIGEAGQEMNFPFECLAH